MTTSDQTNRWAQQAVAALLLKLAVLIKRGEYL